MKDEKQREVERKKASRLLYILIFANQLKDITVFAGIHKQLVEMGIFVTFNPGGESMDKLVDEEEMRKIIEADPDQLSAHPALINRLHRNRKAAVRIWNIAHGIDSEQEAA